MGLPNLCVVGTGSYLPEKIVKTEEFDGKELWPYDFDGTKSGESRRFTTQKLVDLTGIHERRKSRDDEWPSDMGYIAAKRALERSGVEAKDLAGIVVASVTEKKNFPSAAIKVQEKLGVKNTVPFDLQAACAGFPLALTTANSLSRDFPGYWLVIASETLTKINDGEDINSHLFGDGAGAAVLGPAQDGKGILKSYCSSEPFENGIKMIFKDPVNGCIRMPDGAGVLRRAVYAMTESAVILKRNLGWNRADVYIPHQANERIIAGVEKNLRDDGAIVYRNIAKYGNMSAATCAVALDEAIKDGTIKERNKVIITSFGSGLITSAVAMQF